MTSPPRQIEVQCPGCQKIFKDGYRPSINLSLGENWTEEEIAEAKSVKCPRCHLPTPVGSLVVGRDGTFNAR